MAEQGGATTQSGILYQNSITVLYLGQLCAGESYPAHERVVEVRPEAPTIVDDIVLEFMDGHRAFVHVKEAVDVGGIPWIALWQDFARQFMDADFQRGKDRLVLYVGDIRNEYRAVHAMAERADGSRDHEEWQGRLTQNQRRLYGKIQEILVQEGLGTEARRVLFASLDVHQVPLKDLTFRLCRELPPASVRPITLSRVLRDRVGENARIRKAFRSGDLIESLQAEHGITFSKHPPANSMSVSRQSFLPEDRSRLQWFVSSRMSSGCLRAEREAVEEVIGASGMAKPWLWENYQIAGQHPYERTCLHFAAASDGLVLILADEITPLCKKEYLAAKDAGKPCFIFVRESSSAEPLTNQFIEEQRTQGSNPVYFRNTAELKSLLNNSLMAECVRAFRHSYHMGLSVAAAEEARL